MGTVDDSGLLQEPPGKRAAEAAQGTLSGSGREHRQIALVLAGIAFLLVVLPCGYGWQDQGRAHLAQKYRAGAHDVDGTCYTCQVSADGHHAPALHIGKDYLHEVMSGGINGLLIMMSTVLAGIGADVPSRGVFAMGLASLTSYSCSMGLSTFIVESAKNQFSWKQLNEEHQEVREKPQEEISEMVCHYRKQGVSEEDAQLVAKVLSKYESFWVRHMMAEELGIEMPRPSHAPLASGLVTSVSFLLCGAVPLLGVILSVVLSRLKGPQWYHPQSATLLALALSSCALITLGVLMAQAIGSQSPAMSGLLMLANGCLASVFALILSKACCFASQDLPTHLEQGRGPGQGQGQAPGCQGQGQGQVLVRSQSKSNISDDTAWFRRHFFRGLFLLWVVVCTVIVSMQFAQRMAYDSLRVFLYGGLTCVTTGLGALPFLMIQKDSISEGMLAVANAVAGGMMLTASAGMVWEAHEHSGPLDWQVWVGLVTGCLFIRASQHLHGGDGEEGEDVLVLHEAFIEKQHLRKALLIFTVMFCHSAAEGIAVGVAFDKQVTEGFGLYVALLLAVHNVPEGLAVALVLVPRGVSVGLASVIAILTSVPQPLLALAAFHFVDAFQWLLPIGLAFASGAMVFVCLQELLVDSVEQLGWRNAVQVTGLSSVAMAGIMAALHYHVGL